MKWLTKYWSARIAEQNSLSLKVNRHSIKRRVLKTSPKDVLIAAGQRNNRETTETVKAAVTAATGKPQGERFALLFHLLNH
jgi:hypothetical protein